MSSNPVVDYAAAKPHAGASFGKGIFGWVVFILLAVAWVEVKSHRTNSTALPLSTVNSQLLQHNVLTVTIDGNQLIGQFRYPVSSITSFRTYLPDGLGSNWEFVKWLMDQGPQVTAEQNVVMNLLAPMIPWLLIFGVIWFLFFRQIRASNKKRVSLLPSSETGTNG